MVFGPRAAAHQRGTRLHAAMANAVDPQFVAVLKGGKIDVNVISAPLSSQVADRVADFENWTGGVWSDQNLPCGPEPKQFLIDLGIVDPSDVTCGWVR